MQSQDPFSAAPRTRSIAPHWFKKRYGTIRGFIRLVLARAEHFSGRLHSFDKRDLSNVKRLVFVCQGNICRSSFGEGVARHYGLNATSIGLATTTGGPANERTILFGKELAVDLLQHRTTDIKDFKAKDGDLFLVMEVRQARALSHRLGAGAKIALLGAWSPKHFIHLHDPYTLDDAYFRVCLARIHEAVRQLNQALRAQGSPCADSDNPVISAQALEHGPTQRA